MTVFVGFQLVIEMATSAVPCEHGWSFAGTLARLKDLNIALTLRIPIRIIKVKP